MILPVLLITLVAFVSQVSPNSININVDQNIEPQGSPNNVNIDVHQKVNPGESIKPEGIQQHDIFGKYTIENDIKLESSQCLNGDTGAEVAEADVAGLTLYADADPPTCPGTNELLKAFFAVLTKKLRAHIKANHDPLTLPNATANFSKKVGTIRFHGNVSAYNGSLRGLATINLCGKLTKDSENRVNGIKLSADFKELKGHYDLEVSFMSHKVYADVTLESVNYTLSISVSLDRKLCRLQVTNVNIDLGHLSFTVCGLGELDSILDSILDKIGKEAKHLIEAHLENLLKGLVDDVLDGVDLSPYKDILGCDESATSEMEIMFTTNPLA